MGIFVFIVVVVLVVVVAVVRERGNEEVEVELLEAVLDGLSTAVVVNVLKAGIRVFELEGKISSTVRL